MLNRIAMPLLAWQSGHFEQSGGAHSAANTHGHHNILHAASLAFDESMPDQPRTAHTIGVPHSDGAAVDIEAVIGKAQLIAAVNHLHGESLVQLPQAYIFELDAGA